MEFLSATGTLIDLSIGSKVWVRWSAPKGERGSDGEHVETVVHVSPFGERIDLLTPRGKVRRLPLYRKDGDPTTQLLRNYNA